MAFIDKIVIEWSLAHQEETSKLFELIVNFASEY